MMKLGKNQLQRLMGLGSPGCLLVVATDRVSQSLLAKGLVAPRFPDDTGAWHGMTPKGLRALADALEAGECEQFFKKFPREKAAAMIEARQ